MPALSAENPNLYHTGLVLPTQTLPIHPPLLFSTREGKGALPLYQARADGRKEYTYAGVKNHPHLEHAPEHLCPAGLNGMPRVRACGGAVAQVLGPVMQGEEAEEL